MTLVRHPQISEAYRGVCYGRLDVPLSAAGAGGLGVIAAALDAQPARVVHSGLSRTRRLAAAIAARFGVPLIADARLAERDYGAWEGRTWDAIYAETGVAMMGSVTDPAGWRPPGGETTFGLRDRVVAWYQEQTLPVVAVTHGGPVAALLGTLDGHPVGAWPGLVPACGGVTVLPLWRASRG